MAPCSTSMGLEIKNDELLAEIRAEFGSSEEAKILEAIKEKGASS